MKIYNEYGPTESTIGCTVKELSHSADILAVGKPIRNTRIYVLDKNMGLQALGIKGEIAIEGTGLAQGYINHPRIDKREICNP